MNERRRGLGRGLGALIPTGPAEAAQRPSDVFFRESHGSAGLAVAVSRETDAVPDERPHLWQAPADPLADAGASGPFATDPTGSAPADSSGSADTLREVPGARYVELPVDLIRPNPKQPRTVFDADELAELVESIRQIGVLQPVVVRRRSDGGAGGAEPDPVEGPRPATPDGGQGRADEGPLGGDGLPPGGSYADAPYELVMGERRWRACREAGLATVPAIIRETADEALLRDALLENLHRSQLNPLEEAAAYQQLLDDFGCTHDELAARIGRSRPQISNTLRLLRLPPLVARRLAAGVLSAGHARALLGLDDAAAMERLAQRIVAEGLSVRSVEEIVAVGASGTGAARPTRRPRESPPRPERLDEVAARLSDRFDTRVSVAMGRRKGKLTVEFASVQDLDRILELLAP